MSGKFEQSLLTRPWITGTLLFLLAVGMVGTVKGNEEKMMDSEYLWNTTQITREPLFFVRNGADELPKSNVVNKVEEILEITDDSGSIKYVPGKDYILSADRKTIELPQDSAIVFLKAEDLYPEPDAPHSYPQRANSKQNMLHSEDSFFITLQPKITYKCAENTLKAPGRFGDIPKFKAKIKAKQPLNIMIFGDSISVGASASGFLNIPPFEPTQYERLKIALLKSGVESVSMENFSRGGMNSDWAVDNVKMLLESKNIPDLVILAWGMNDAWGVTPEKYQQNITQLIEAIKSKFPETEFVLISSMPANTQWGGIAHEYYPIYRQKLIEKADNKSIAVCDVMFVYQQFVERKGFMSLTGNGLNHPNDFGHKIYAEVLTDTILNNQ